MNIYLAPMEGLTGYIYRNQYDKHFGRGKIDKYFIPFISPNQSNGYTSRERADIDPAHNQGLYAVPQIMANNSRYFMRAANMLYDMGYREINLNLGCPSGTVVSKFRGAGFLAKPDELDAFLDAVFQEPLMQQMSLSIKTRIGMDSADEFSYLLTIYNQYPLKELIIHPRVRSDYYKNKPDWSAFGQALRTSKNPVCYNGDIFTKQDYLDFTSAFGEVTAVMLGRGLVADPALIAVLKAKEGALYERDLSADKQAVKAFHDDVYQAYLRVMSGDKNAIHKMKEIWIYMRKVFSGGDKEFKMIKKAQRMCDYQDAVSQFFANAKLQEQAHLYF